jgi:hypothetical protein
MSNLTDNKPDLDKIKKQLTKNLTKYVSRSWNKGP